MRPNRVGNRLGHFGAPSFAALHSKGKERTVKQLSKLVWSISAALALVVAMGATSPAAAQPQVAAGYQFMRSEGSNYPAGWFADFAFPLNTNMLSIVGDVSGAYKTESVPTGLGTNVDVTGKQHTFMGGIRYTLMPSGKMTPFAQFLFGAAATSASGGGTTVSETKGALDFGGGINYELNDTWTLRLGVDFRRIMSDPAANQVRIVVGVILPIGG